MRLHARIAEALEALYGEDSDQYAAELAHHFAQAQTLLGPDKFVRYSLVAGEAALAASRTSRLSLISSARWPRKTTRFDDETAALYFGRGRAQLASSADTSSSPPRKHASRLRLLRPGWRHRSGGQRGGLSAPPLAGIGKHPSPS